MATLEQALTENRHLTTLQTKGKAPKAPPYYNYKPLPTGWIRLLQMHGDEYKNDENKASSSSPLRVTLSDHPLSSCPEFTALSYTWGSPTKDIDPTHIVFTAVPRCFPIISNRKLLLGTRNLRDALRRIRQAQKRPTATKSGSLSAYLWIDALCIDQDDLDERAHQVLLMSDIYSTAKTCLVWLGEIQSTVSALDLFPRLVNHVIPATGEVWPRPSNRRSKIFPAITSLTHEEALAVCQLLSLTWFSRLWILQEVILPQRVMVMCSSQITSFAPILTIGYLLASCNAFGDLVTQSSLTGVERDVMAQRVYQSCTMLALVCRAQGSKSEDGGGLSPADVLGVVSKSSATDERDKIYGALGFTCLFDREALSNIQVDYKLPVDEVYTRSTISILEKTKRLDILQLVCDPRGRKYPKLPSWCPDYAVDSTLLGTFHFIKGNPLDDLGWDSEFSCPVTLSSHDSRCLIVGGFRFDTIRNMTTPTDRDRHLTAEFAYTRLAEVVALAATLEDGSSVSRVERLWRLLIHDLFSALGHPDVPPVAGLFFPGMLVLMVAGSTHPSRPGWAVDSKDRMASLAQEVLSSLERSVRILVGLEPESAASLPHPEELGFLSNMLVQSGEISLDDVLTFYGAPRLLGRATEYGLKDELLALLGLECWGTEAKLQMDLAEYMARLYSRTGLAQKLTAEFRYFTTDSSHLIGNGYGHIDESCELWFLKGYSSPVLLRKSGDSGYEFCGTAVVSGQWPKETLIDIKTITLV